MARWRLLEPHYMNCIRDGARSEWEYKEISRSTGREIRKKFLVPTLLDPKIAEDWNHRPNIDEDGWIVVSDGNNSQPRDIVMVKDAQGRLPITPSMDPLDDEARALSAEYNKRIVPIEGRDEATYSERLLDHFIEQLGEARTNATATPGVDKVLESIAGVMQQQTEILAKLTEKRRV